MHHASALLFLLLLNHTSTMGVTHSTALLVKYASTVAEDLFKLIIDILVLIFGAAYFVVSVCGTLLSLAIGLPVLLAYKICGPPIKRLSSKWKTRKYTVHHGGVLVCTIVEL
ncbi:hypothetical protein PHLGIDRAFT_459113 [Phlebiopsis gigantea 11061_1 CR5-6]|uniref:Uncharacterized protein n=1 Tax=Phlebiopsis gigantea (strain 11061_1 CR5-6) TaxID=745531 RepID=A0A0C3NN20_PHLG1|nr:hypothetical protein PHLGIDRAFT_459113 [Phlebiopsis gigantea 11061_1 CR5-6]